MIVRFENKGMKDTIIISIWAFLAISIITGIVVYRKAVTPTLEKYGRNAAWPALPSDQFKQWSEYKRICVENRLSLKYWRILIASQIAGGVGLVAWIAILIMYR
jgi:hypothetical protein